MEIIDNLIIITFLFITIIVGFIAARGITTVREFAVGNKDFMTLTLVMTIFATWVDGQVILSESKMGFQSGLAYLLVPLGASFALFLNGFIATRITPYYNAISPGDIVKELYGHYSQVFVGISGFLMSMTFVATQFKSLSFLFNYFYGVNPDFGVWLSALILITYSILGGVRAVTWTDVFQFFVLINVVPLVASVAINKDGGFFNLITSLPADRTTFDLPKETIITYIAYFFSITIPIISPPVIQRMLMSTDPRQTKKAYWIASLISVPFFSIVVLTGVAGYMLLPNADPNNIYLALINETLPAGIKGFAIAGILAVIMSSADSFMNTAAVSISHDFCKPLLKDKLNEKYELIIIKTTTLITGLIACYAAMKYDSIVELMLYSFILWGPVVAIPLIGGVFGFKPPKYGFYASMFAGVATAVIWNFFKLEETTLMGGLIPALLANFFTFTVCYLIGKYSNKHKVA